DIYAYGMILWEIASRSSKPYKYYYQDVIPALVPNGIREDIPDETPTAYSDIIKKCWGTVPSERPNAEDVVKEIQELDDNKKYFVECLDDSDLDEPESTEVKQ